ncbi:MAG: cytoplasmic protein [Clostridia bacterium]|nr:cytoplasmic protein [Clostridia bacterium]MBQ8382581.1 cytoplasmic protein [Clostridia bacterium]
MNEQLRSAHKHCTRNHDDLSKSKICGCFHCQSIYSPDEITDWLKEGCGTALCPRCGIDAVIGEEAGYPITKEFLQEMHESWFVSKTKA